MNAPYILYKKKKFWIQLFPHRVLIDQLGCTCDNNFAIIKINPDHSSEDHRSQITVVSNLSSQQFKPIFLSGLSLSSFLSALQPLSPGSSRIFISDFYGALEVSVLLYLLLVVEQFQSAGYYYSRVVSSSQFFKCSPFSRKQGVFQYIFVK